MKNFFILLLNPLTNLLLFITFPIRVPIYYFVNQVRLWYRNLPLQIKKEVIVETINLFLRLTTISDEQRRIMLDLGLEYKSSDSHTFVKAKRSYCKPPIFKTV